MAPMMRPMGSEHTPTSTVDYRTAVGAAVRAPSLHNSQPWLFRLRGDLVEVRLDPLRRLPASDPTGWAARIAAGAALFNLRTAVSMQGWEPAVRLLPHPADPDLFAELRPIRQRPATRAEERLWEAIWRRHSNRAPFWPDPVPAEARTRLAAAATAEGGWLTLLIAPGPVSVLAQIAQVANQVLMRNPQYQAELAAWTRRDSTALDGVPADAAGPGPAPQDLLPQRLFGTGRRRGVGGDFEPRPLVAVLGTVGDTPGDQLVAGQALQRTLLTANDAGLAVSMLSQPIEVASAREDLRLALHQFGAPQMVLRIGYAVPGSLTPRRPIDDVLDYGSCGSAGTAGLRPKPDAYS